jgi:putative polyhydroxyalkanoate system protein
MWDLTITKSHQSSPDHLRPGIDALLAKVKNDYDIVGSWEGPDHFVVAKGGHVVAGELTIASDAVTINLKLDWLGRLAKGKIEDAIGKELEEIVAKVTPG